MFGNDPGLLIKEKDAEGTDFLKVLSTHRTRWFQLKLYILGPWIILPHDVFNSLYLGVTEYHFHLFLFSFLEQFNCTEQWCLSLSKLSCRTEFSFEKWSTSTPTSPNRATTGFWNHACAFHVCFDLFQPKEKTETGGFISSAGLVLQMGDSFLVHFSHMSKVSIKWKRCGFLYSVLSVLSVL